MLTLKLELEGAGYLVQVRKHAEAAPEANELAQTWLTTGSQDLFLTNICVGTANTEVCILAFLEIFVLNIQSMLSGAAIRSHLDLCGIAFRTQWHLVGIMTLHLRSRLEVGTWRTEAGPETKEISQKR